MPNAVVNNLTNALSESIVLTVDTLGEEDCDLPRYRGYHHLNDGDDETTPLLTRGLYDRLFESDNAKTSVIRVDGAIAIDQLHNLIGETIAAVQKNGVEYGSKLAIRMAAGEITASQFDATLLKVEGQTW